MNARNTARPDSPPVSAASAASAPSAPAASAASSPSAPAAPGAPAVPPAPSAPASTPLPVAPSSSAPADLRGVRGLPPAKTASYRAVFFDLDGTLLPMELDEFLGCYFDGIRAFAVRAGFDERAFSAGFSAGVAAMTGHDGSITNDEAFWGAFCARAGGERAGWEPMFLRYYETEFASIGDAVEADPSAARAVRALRTKGYPLVLATMPLFPLVAVEKRLTWAGVDPLGFARVTRYDNSRSAKPSAAYYAENLAACGLSGADVLMVGNNAVEDLAFRNLGAEVYLATDFLLNPTGADVSDVAQGTLAAFADWAEELPACQNPATGIEQGAVDAAARAAALAANLRAERKC